MFGETKGKRLLILGGIRPMCEAVEYAKEMGIYTMVTDYLEDSPAKKIADQSFMVSTMDVDALEELCKAEHVDGVFAAFMDGVLPVARELCDRMGYPFYASNDQIRMSHDKSFFKETCMRFGVPTAIDYTAIVEAHGFDSDLIKFPVIVKPVDAGGGRGITICDTPEELKKAYDYAMSISVCKRVLVEEYMIGDDVTATYTMKDGEVSLSVFRDKLISHDHKNIQSQADILLNPSKRLRWFMETTDVAIRRMLKGMGATDGSVFFQGIASEEKIAIFELGYRVNNACDYRHISQENGINYMKMMIAHAVTGKMGGYELSQDNPFFSKFLVTCNIWAHEGIIGKLEGLEEVKKIENITLAEYKHDEGDLITAAKPYQQCVFRAIIVDDDIQKVQETILKIQSIVKCTDTEGNNMLYKPFDVHRLDGRILECR